ncbi:murein DD-endopeptidase MepM/ murein hydrolase activator NlpD [Mycetocola sp. BIGb0189]|uniref:M23 family metallopeptidase n=1 Tax=Mycetocola sp. BIGb0189 TaxID=2940604 RepID=UPI0021686574|nr:peptidoglycan DD-metalloendopeptidase family protein [Mycetocola sp. BIGb0189]MCS4277246.1 murein DD-endopeptidase MepM/ murein hydrolase activator NlpD [Mycetocola sp. BIGb0189]
MATAPLPSRRALRAAREAESAAAAPATPVPTATTHVTPVPAAASPSPTSALDPIEDHGVASVATGIAGSAPAPAQAPTRPAATHAVTESLAETAAAAFIAPAPAVAETHAPSVTEHADSAPAAIAETTVPAARPTAPQAEQATPPAPRTPTAAPSFSVPTFDEIFSGVPAAGQTAPAAARTEDARSEQPQTDTHTPRQKRGTRAPRSASAHRTGRPQGPRAARRPLRRAVFSALIVPALFGTAALPAFAIDSSASAAGPTGYSAMQLIRGESKAPQTLTVSASAAVEDIDRGTYETSRGAMAPTGYNASSALEAYAGPSALGWWRPLPGPITSPYGPRGLICNSVGCSNSFHEGMDFAGASGTPVRAIFGGTVTFVGNAGAFGNRVIVDHGNGEVSLYGHLLTGSAEVKVGQTVEAGQILAGVGATGVVSGPHLDLKIEIDGQMTDPAAFLRSKGVPV